MELLLGSVSGRAARSGEKCLWNQSAWVWIPVPLLPSCVALGMSLHSLGLIFLVDRMEVLIPVSWVVVRIKWANMCEVLRTTFSTQYTLRTCYCFVVTTQRLASRWERLVWFWCPVYYVFSSATCACCFICTQGHKDLLLCFKRYSPSPYLHFGLWSV